MRKFVVLLVLLAIPCLADESLHDQMSRITQSIIYLVRVNNAAIDLCGEVVETKTMTTSELADCDVIYRASEAVHKLNSKNSPR